MFSTVSSLALAATLLLPVADTIPRFNVEPSCRAAAEMGDSLDARFQRCLDDERQAREQLQAEWKTFSSQSHRGCNIAASAGGDPSYVELLECLIMERDAKQMEKANPNDFK